MNLKCLVLTYLSLVTDDQGLVHRTIAWPLRVDRATTISICYRYPPTPTEAVEVVLDFESKLPQSWHQKMDTFIASTNSWLQQILRDWESRSVLQSSVIGR